MSPRAGLDWSDLKGRKGPRLPRAWRLPGRPGAGWSRHWGPRAAATGGYQRAAAWGGLRRTSAAPAQTPAAAWSWLVCSGTRSWPGSPSASAGRRTLPARLSTSTASHGTSSPGRWAAGWWRVSGASCWVYASSGYSGVGPGVAWISDLKHIAVVSLS